MISTRTGVEPGDGRRGRRAWSLAMAVALGLAFAASGVGCSDQTNEDFQEGSNAQLRVQPQIVTFSQTRPGEVATELVEIANIGDGTLTVLFESYELTGDDQHFVFSFATDAEGNVTETLEPNETAIITIDYIQPAEIDRTYSATLRLEATNGDVAEIDINTTRPSPLLEVVPNPILFTDVSPGSSGEQTVTVANRGSADLEIYQMAYQPENTLDFAIKSGLPEPGTVLAPDQSLELVVEYTPTGALDETDRGLLLIDSNASGGIEQRTTVEIIGTVAGPLIEVEPIYVDFGSIAQNATEVRDVVIRNVGEGTLDVSAIYLNFDSSPDFAYSDVETVQLEEGEETTITVSYTPTGSGTDSGFLNIESNSIQDEFVIVSLHGAWAGPDLVVRPTLLEFGTVTAGVTKPLTFDIYNEGSLPLTIEAFNEDAFPAAPQLTYTVDTGETPPFDIEGNGKRTVTVTFAPTEELGPASSFLDIVSNDPETSTERVEMRYTGVLDGECEVRITPTDVNYGLVPGGYTSIQSVAVENIGSAPCQITNVQIQGDFFSSFYGNPFSLVTPVQMVSIAPGDTELVEVLYAPFSGDTDSFAASLNFYISDPLNGTHSLACPSSTGGGGFPGFPGGGGCTSFGTNSPCWACLSGTTGDPSLAAVPGNVDFGLVTLGCSSQNTRVRIYNRGTAPTDIVNVSLAPTCPASFALAGVPPTPFTLQSGTFQEVEVVYTPASTASEACTLIIEGSTETLSVPLQGEGTTDDNVHDVFDQVSGRKVDVLFVVDNSGSMGDEQQNLANNFSSFIQAALTWGVDFQIGVTTTDDSDEGRLQSRNGKPRIIRSSLMTDAEVTSAFQDNIRVGDNGSATERGLKAGERALSDPNITADVPADCANDPATCGAPYSCMTIDGTCGGHNARFLREDASLEVIFVSDESDQSPAVLSFYVDFFKNIKGFANDSLFHAHAIVGNNASGSCDTSSFQRYVDVAAATGGQVEPLCGNFATGLANIGNNAFGLRVQFFLSRVPEPATIAVTVDGMAVTSGWSYDNQSNSIIFDTAPGESSVIEVDYKAACF